MNRTVAHILRTVVMALLLLIGFGSTASAQLSPGDLAEPHQELEGLSNCTQCHELGEGPSAKKCLNCHQSLSARISADKGYHSRIMEDKNNLCFKCHSDHAGREFQLINWRGAEKSFDHDSTGYHLEGKHSKTECRDCHKPENIHLDRSIIDPSLNFARTYLGLDKTCLNCHFDQHRAQQTNECTSCHGPDSWKPATLFSHDRTSYPLTGKHAAVDCLKCHPSLADTKYTESPRNKYIKYTNIGFKSCLDCHKDIHKGRYEQSCRSCHSTDSWRNISSKNFDHDKTDYALRGKHRKVKCEGCHKGKSMTDAVKFDLCTDCHADGHNSQFVSRDDQGRCESCHDVERFQPSLYTIANHQQSQFKLLGAHLAQPCIACHKLGIDENEKQYRLFKIKSEACIDCHNDLHYGQFLANGPIKGCTDCHNSDQWRIDEFDHDGKSSYKLTGAHKKVACKGCHQSELIAKIQVTKYRPIDSKCESCHKLKMPNLMDAEGSL